MPGIQRHGRQQSRGNWGVSGLILATLVASCLFSSSYAKAQVKEVRRVLIIHAFGASVPSTIRADDGIRSVLENSPYQIEVYHEYLETGLFADPSSWEKSRESYLEKYRDHKPDVMVVVGSSALEFMSESRESLFPDTPIVFCCAIPEIVPNLKLDSRFTGTWMVAEVAKILDVGLQLAPGTRHVVVVGGAGQYDRRGEELVRRQSHSYESGLEFTYLTELTMPILLERLKQLPDHTIIIYTSFQRDAAGTHFVDATQSIPMITAAANAPVFVSSDALIGNGAVGGYVVSYIAQGRGAGELALRILKGERPQDIPIVAGTDSYMFDWRELHRWGMKEGNLPAGSTVLYRVPTGWQKYGRRIAVFVFLFVGLLFLCGYLWLEHRRRKRAEGLLIRKLRFETLLSEISDELIGLPPAQMETEIQKGLVRLRQFLGVARISIFEFAQHESMLRLRHSARDEGIAAAPEKLSKLPWIFSRLAGTEAVVTFPLDKLPTDDGDERGLFRRINPGTMGMLPLKNNAGLIGVLSFVMMPAPSAWPDDLVPQLKAASHVYANVFDTELARTALLESEDRFRLIGDATPAFIWISDRDGNFTYLNKKVLEFTGANAQEHDKYGWLGQLHPDDLAAVLEGNVKAVQERERFTREYRMRRHDGVYRWIFDIGNPRFSAEGSFLGFIGSAVDVTDQKTARESLENVGGQLIDAQERERSRIARELHDDICQRLAMISLKVEKVTKGSTGEHAAIGQQLEQIWQQCSDLTGDVQALSHKLHPSALDNLGLIIAVNSFCREFSEQNGAVVNFTHMKIPDSLPREVSLSLFRIIQETLHNAAKYSGVKQFEVDLQGKSSEIELEVSDRGTGFELANVKTAKGLGLVSMRERIHLLNGTISIESTPNVGTRIRAWVPLTPTSSAKSAHSN